MILAAGLGTRLHPLTLERPKPGIPYDMRPLACIALDSLAKAGVTSVVVNTHHLAEELPRLLEPHIPSEMTVRYVHEPKLLGTGGGVRNALGPTDGEPTLILNSDIVFSPDLASVLSLHQELDAIATMVLRPDPDAARFGTVEIDATGRVQRLLGSPEREGDWAAFMFTGVHVLSPRALDDLPTEGCIVQHAYRRWVDAGSIVAGCVDESPWADLGTLERYLSAHVSLARDANRIHSSAEIHSDAELICCVVGEGAHVGPHRLTRVVVWPNACVDEDLEDAVVTPLTTVRVHA